MENFLVSVIGNATPSLMTTGFSGSSSFLPSHLMASLQPHSAVTADVPRRARGCKGTSLHLLPTNPQVLFFRPLSPWLCWILPILPVLANGRESGDPAISKDPKHCTSVSCWHNVWVSDLVFLSANPCELHCRPVDGHFSEKMLDAVTDGTPCFEGRHSRDICINGMCKVLGMFACFFLYNLILKSYGKMLNHFLVGSRPSTPFYHIFIIKAFQVDIRVISTLYNDYFWCLLNPLGFAYYFKTSVQESLFLVRSFHKVLEL